jgi:repressor LexA
MQTGEIIRTLREKQGMSQEALAAKLGYKDRSSIAKIEGGKVDLSQSKLEQLSALFRVPVTQLMGLSPMPQMNSIPILGTIACGAPILAQEHIEGYTSLPQDIKADFALICKGDSMIGARIFPGDIVYIRRQEQVENGQIAAVLIDGEATLKRIRIYADSLCLQPENPKYAPRIFWGEEMNAITILGRAVAFTSCLQ